MLSVCFLTRYLYVLRLSLLDFVLVYEEIDDEPPTKEVSRFRNRYMKNLQKSQLEFEEVCLSLCLNFLLKNPRLKIFDKRNSKAINFCVSGSKSCERSSKQTWRTYFLSSNGL